MAKNPSNQELVASFVQDERHLQKLLFSHELDSFFFYQDDEGYFKIQDHQLKDFDSYLYDYLDSKVTKNLSPALIDNVKELIKLKIYRKIGFYEPEYIALKDSLLSLNTFETHPHDISKIAFTYLPFDSTTLLGEQSMPLFQKFLDEVVITDDDTPDPELQALIQEMFGYCLLPTTKAEKTFFLVGEGANGKSVLLNVLRHIVGLNNCSSKSIESLTTDRFATSGLVGKSVNICSEEESDYIKSDKFKAIVSGEPIDIERKFGESKSGRFSVKFIFATNEMPTFSGFNHGLLRRMVIIPLKKTIEEDRRDVDLISKLLVELPGIVAWALQGARRLIGRNYRFVLPEACKVKEEEFKENLSSTIQFIKENFVKDEEAFISTLDLYGSYKIWGKDRGVKVVKFSRFSRDLSKICGDSKSQWDSDEKKTMKGHNLKQILDEMPMSSVTENWQPKEKNYPDPRDEM